MKHYFDFKITNDLAQMQMLLEEFSLRIESIGLTLSSLRKVKLVIEELLINTINYGYTDKKQGVIELKIIPNRKSLRLEICDDAVAFNPMASREHTEARCIEDLKIGGLGLIIVRKSCGRIKYKRHDNKNYLSLTIAVSFK